MIGAKTKKYYKNNYISEDRKKAMLNRVREHVEKTGNFGRTGSKAYMKRVKTYFGIADISLKVVEKMKDERMQFRLLAKQNLIDERIRSGEFVESKMNTATENIESALLKVGYDEAGVKRINEAIRKSGAKRFAILSDIWDKLQVFYDSAKENKAGRNKNRLAKDVDDMVTQINNVLASYNIEV